MENTNVSPIYTASKGDTDEGRHQLSPLGIVAVRQVDRRHAVVDALVVAHTREMVKMPSITRGAARKAAR